MFNQYIFLTVMSKQLDRLRNSGITQLSLSLFKILQKKISIPIQTTSKDRRTKRFNSQRQSTPG